MTTTTAGDYSVVVPAYAARETLPACLSALRAAVPPPAEIIVYDDASPDDTAQIARRFGARVIEGQANRGPAYGRNRGAEAASSDVVVFVDADVAVRPDAPGKLARAVQRDEATVAAFGAYADRAADVVTNQAGRYANLRHHHVHAEAAQAGGEAETFWSGLGAVDRRAYLAAKGFDEAYGRPSIEDVELGLRLRRADGRIAIVGDANGDHLKDWTLRQLWRTDVFERAIPWSQLAASGRIAPTLNADAGERIKAVAAHLVWMSALLALLLAPSSSTAASVALVGAFGSLVAYAALNRAFLAVLARNGLGTLLSGAALHWLYHCYASAIYAVTTTTLRLRTTMRRRDAAHSAAQKATPGA